MIPAAKGEHVKYRLSEIQAITGGELVGDPATVITGVASLGQAQEGDLSFVKSEKFVAQALQSRASALVAPKRLEGWSKPLLIAADPTVAFAAFLERIAAQKHAQRLGVHPSAIVGEGAKLGPQCSVGPHVVIGRDTIIGARVIIYPNVTIGDRCEIGEGTVIYSNVSIREEVKIGKRAIIQCNAVIGCDGFGFTQADGKHVKIPQVGAVEIGDDVEIGSNTTVARAALDKTIIGRGVKIDAHSHVAHNVVIGEDSMLVAYAKLSGGVKIGKGVMIAGDASFVQNIEIGDYCIIAAGAGVSHSLEPRSVVWGAPAKPMALEKRIQAILKKLPELREEVRALKRGERPKPS